MNIFSSLFMLIWKCIILWLILAMIKNIGINIGCGWCRWNSGRGRWCRSWGRTYSSSFCLRLSRCRPWTPSSRRSGTPRRLGGDSWILEGWEADVAPDLYCGPTWIFCPTSCPWTMPAFCFRFLVDRNYATLLSWSWTEF